MQAGEKKAKTETGVHILAVNYVFLLFKKNIESCLGLSFKCGFGEKVGS